MTNLEFLAHVELPPENENFTMEALRSYQLERINYTLQYAAERSRFYRKQLANVKIPLTSLAELQYIGMTSAQDLTENGMESFLCVKPEKINRIVTLQTSGSTGKPKRIGFTEKDLFGIIHFFDFALQDITSEQKKILVCMPGKRENGLYDLLSKGADRFDAEAFYYGSITDFEAAANYMDELCPHCIIGIPMQIFGLAKYLEWKGRRLKKPVETILLSSDILVQDVRKKIETVFECPVFNHYGTTEMGYAAALECSGHSGMHLREAEMFFEVVDTRTGCCVPCGHYGELVFTTLRREGMPLIRYRTGDSTRYIPGRCSCGTELPGIEAPKRISGQSITLQGNTITLDRLDKAFLNIDGLLDYEFVFVKQEGKEFCLNFYVWYLDESFANENMLRNQLKAAGYMDLDVKVSFYDMTDSGIDLPGCRGKRCIHEGGSVDFQYGSLGKCMSASGRSKSDS